jgi:hypothetical protein
MMSEAESFRKWAAQVARQAGEEPDANQARRLLSIAEYWVRLAEVEDLAKRLPGHRAVTPSQPPRARANGHATR